MIMPGFLSGSGGDTWSFESNEGRDKRREWKFWKKHPLRHCPGSGGGDIQDMRNLLCEKDVTVRPLPGR